MSASWELCNKQTLASRGRWLPKWTRFVARVGHLHGLRTACRHSGASEDVNQLWSHRWPCSVSPQSSGGSRRCSESTSGLPLKAFEDGKVRLLLSSEEAFVFARTDGSDGSSWRAYWPRWCIAAELCFGRFTCRQRPRSSGRPNQWKSGPLVVEGEGPAIRIWRRLLWTHSAKTSHT